MTDFFRVASTIYHWLQNQNIDEDKVSVTIRAKDPETLARLEASIKREMTAPFNFTGKPANLKNFKVQGVSFSIGPQLVVWTGDDPV